MTLLRVFFSSLCTTNHSSRPPAAALFSVGCWAAGEFKRCPTLSSIFGHPSQLFYTFWSQASFFRDFLKKSVNYFCRDMKDAQICLCKHSRHPLASIFRNEWLLEFYLSFVVTGGLSDNSYALIIFCNFIMRFPK